MGKSELQRACEETGITISSVHIVLEGDPDANQWKDKWSCTISYQDRSATFDYWTGIGHRVVADGWKVEGPSKWGQRFTGDVVFGIKDAIAKGVLVLKRVKNEETKRREVAGPSVADVLSCLLSETRACTTTFDDWCSDYGDNNDSLKALNTYLACQRNGSKVIRLLGSKLVEELSQKEH
jgi:hypothetical protein